MAFSMLKRSVRLPLFSRLSLIRPFSTGEFNFIKVEEISGVGKITLNRPKALNALCDDLIAELNSQLRSFDANEEIGAIVLTGSSKAFAAGADIKEMSSKTFAGAYNNNMLLQWKDITNIRTPVIAAVDGYALGGGCELAMMCDIILASDKSQFGQPEIKLGVIPGCGGTQRLIRAVGKSKAMDMILTGRMVPGKELEKAGLVSRIVKSDDLVTEAVKMGKVIASYSRPVVRMCKEAVNASYENSLEQGVNFEGRLFHSCFGLDDQSEGMSAFMEKRSADWSHK